MFEIGKFDLLPTFACSRCRKHRKMVMFVLSTRGKRSYYCLECRVQYDQEQGRGVRAADIIGVLALQEEEAFEKLAEEFNKALLTASMLIRR